MNGDVELSPRRGWQLPRTITEPPASSDTESRGSPDASPPPGPSASRRRPDTSPAPTMRGSLLGQVTQVTVGSTTTGDNSMQALVMRIERHDPHAGRTSISDVRIDGDESIGFASVGDWVEARGKRKSSHLRAVRCINHTTGAVYAPSWLRRHRMLLAVAVFLVFVAVMVTVFVAFERIADEDLRRDPGELREQCLQSGVPPSLCDGLP